MQPIVSIIMPTYEGADLIERSIKSALLQTMPDFELIIIDDATPDNTEEVVNQFDDSRIVYIKRAIRSSVKNGENPRNDGLKAARGKYICYLDHDDTYRLGFLEVMSSYLDEHPEVGLAYCDSIWHRNGERADLARSVDFNMVRMVRRNIIGVLTVMHRREIVDKIGYFKRGFCRPFAHSRRRGRADWDYWCRVSEHFEIKHVPIILGDKIHRSSDNYRNKDFAPWEA